MVAEIKTALPVASLVCKRHVAMAQVCLGSLLRQARTPLGLTLFDDGTLDDADVEQLREALPGVGVVRAAESEEQMANALRQSPHCQRLRQRYPLLRKLLDVPLQMARPFLYCDTDVLFLRPFTLTQLRARLAEEFIYLRDIREGYSAGLRQFIVHRSIPLISKANAGLSGIPFARYDLEFVEWFLSIDAFQVFPEMLEQTCWAAMPRGRAASMFDDRQLFCFGHGRQLDEESVGVHFIGSAKDRIGAWQARAEQVVTKESAPTELRIHAARPASVIDVLTSGLRNRLLPPAWR